MGFSDLFSMETIKAAGRGNLWKAAFKRSKGDTSPRGRTMAESWGITEDDLNNASKQQAMERSFRDRADAYVEAHPLEQRVAMREENKKRRAQAQKMTNDAIHVRKSLETPELEGLPRWRKQGG